MIRRFAVAAALCAALLSVAAMAEAPKASIVGPATAAPGSPVVLNGSQAVSDRPLKWTQTRGPAAPLVVLTPQGGPPNAYVLAFPPAAGLYEFKQVAIGTPKDATEVDADAALFSVLVADPNPAPVPAPPTPAPTPDPAPAPVPVPDDGTKVPIVASDPLDVTLVVDPSRMTPVLAAVHDSPSIAGSLKPLTANWHAFATTSPFLATLHYDAAIAKAGGPPAVVVVNAKTHKVVDQFPCPPTEAEVVARISKIRGKP